MDIKIERLTRDFNEAKAKSRTAAADTLVNVIVTCHDAETVAGNIQTLTLIHISEPTRRP